MTAAAVALLILAALAVTMPFLSRLMQKPELTAGYPAFLLLLVATLIRTHAETLYYGLFVRRDHRSIWLGNLVFLAASLGFSLLLIPRFGLMGLGWAAIAASLVIASWRAVALRRPARGGVRAIS